jgi:hypothetical protein
MVRLRRGTGSVPWYRPRGGTEISTRPENTTGGALWRSLWSQKVGEVSTLNERT